MKNHRFFKKAVLAIGLIIAVASCSKENAPAPQYPAPNGDDTKVLGQILDFGNPVSATKGEFIDLRIMTASFTNVGVVLDANTYEAKFAGNSNEVNLTFIVNEDNLIPSGGYVFDSAEVPQSFTLKEGTVKIADTNDQMLQFDRAVTGGSVEVYYDGEKYNFFFNLLLDNVEILRGLAEGKMNYADVHP